MTENEINKIKCELEQIDKLFKSYEVLLNKSKLSNPDLVEITAIAGVLHSFYNGIENVFKIIAKFYNDFPSASKMWHKELLISMAEQKGKRKAVIKREKIGSLSDFLAFRHFYRHSYSFHLNWIKIKPLVLKIEELWHLVKMDIIDFIK